MSSAASRSKPVVEWPLDRLSANVSTLFASLPVARRPQAAVDAGFEAIELWWPFAAPTPDRTAVDAFVDLITRTGLRVTSLNFCTGERSAGERGLLSRADGWQRFMDSLPIAIDIASRLGCKRLNALFGNREGERLSEAQIERGVDMLSHAAGRADEIGALVMVEPLSASEAPEYAVRTSEQVRQLVEKVYDRSGHRIGICFDVYHLYQTEGRLAEVIARSADMIFHVQLADSPCRREPGTGNIDFFEVLGALRDVGYEGYIGLEYYPTSPVTAAAYVL
jgi:hydroxypyruvate isomerase